MTPNADGPDLSHWNTFTGQPGTWPLMSNKATQKDRYRDPTFPGRWQAWREQGVKYRGAYHWLQSNASIASQAAHFCRTIDAAGGLTVGEFAQCDWEVTEGTPVPTSKQAAEWCDRVRQHYGRDCVIVYSSDWLPDSTLDTDSRAEFLEWRDENPNHPLWFANYNTGSRPQGGWAECARYRADLWQWTASYRHPAFTAGVDMNHVFDWSTLDRITAQTTPEDRMAVTRTKYRKDTRLNGGSKVTELRLSLPTARPSWAAGAILNITVTQPAVAGFVVAGPGPVQPQDRAHVTFAAGQTITNEVAVEMSGNTVALWSTCPTHLVVDLIGWCGVVA